MPRISVLVVDPAARTVMERDVQSGDSGLARYTGGKPDICYVSQCFTSHAVATGRVSEDQPGWSLGSGEDQLVFRGPGVLYRIQNSERASQTIGAELLRDAVKWVPNEEQPSSPARNRRQPAGTWR